MFDIGFWELVIIGIIGLVVLGPERLPTAIRSVRTWMNKMRNFSQTVQTEIKEELRIHELHEDLKQAEKMNMENLSPELAQSVESLKQAAEMVNRPFADDKPLAAHKNPTSALSVEDDVNITKSDKTTND